MTTDAQSILSVVMLGGAIWALLFLLPKARREREGLGVLRGGATRWGFWRAMGRPNPRAALRTAL